MWFLENIYNKMVDKPWACVLDIVLTALLIYAAIVFLQKNNAKRLMLYLLPLAVVGIVLSSDVVEIGRAHV